MSHIHYFNSQKSENCLGLIKMTEKQIINSELRIKYVLNTSHGYSVEGNDRDYDGILNKHAIGSTTTTIARFTTKKTFIVYYKDNVLLYVYSNSYTKAYEKIRDYLTNHKRYKTFDPKKLTVVILKK